MRNLAFILFFVLTNSISLVGWGQCPSVSATMPDSACMLSPITATNTSGSGLTFEWDFSLGDLEKTPAGVNIGTYGVINGPRQVKIVKQDTLYYLFIANAGGNNLIRLDYGNSLSNTPTTYNYGNMVFLNLPSGLDVVKQNGIYYAFMSNASNNRIMRINLGSKISDNTASLTDLGTFGTSGARTLRIERDSQGCYVFVTSDNGNKVTRIDFGNSFGNTPVGSTDHINSSFGSSSGFDFAYDCTQNKYIGFFGNFNTSQVVTVDYGSSLSNSGTILNTLANVSGPPGGVQVLQEGKNWYLIVTGFLQKKLTLYKLGTSLLNTPVLMFNDTVGDLSNPKSLDIIQEKSMIIGFTSNSVPNSISKFTWPDSNLSTPLFSNSSTTASFTPGQSGIFNISLTGYDSTSNLSYTYVDSVFLTSAPNASFSVSPACNGSPVIFTDNSTIVAGDSIISWTWDFGDGSPQSNQQNPMHLFSNTGGYLVTLTAGSSQGCDNSFQDSVFISDLPIVDFAFNNNSCSNTAIAFNDQSVAVGNSTLSKWLWDFDDGSPLDTNQNPMHIFNTPGTYNVTLVVEIQNGCADSITYPVTIIASPEAAFTSANTCEGQTVAFTNNTTIAGAIPVSYQWDFGDTNTSILNNPTHLYTGGPANYNITLIATAVNGCSDTLINDIRIAAQPIPGFSFTPAIACNGNIVYFTDGSTGNGIDTTLTYNWDFGDSDTSTLANPDHTYLTPGNYTITLTATVLTSCDSSISQPITILPGPTCSFTKINTCEYDSIQFNAITTTPTGTVIDSITWDFGDGTSYSGLNSPTHLYQTAGTFYVTMTLYNDLLCTDTYIDSVIVYPAPTAAYLNSLPCSGGDIIFDGSISTGNGSNVTGWLWDFGGLGNSNDTMPIFSFADSGSYNITLIVLTQNGCADTLINPINIIKSPDFDFTYNDPCLGEATTFTFVPLQTPTPPSNLFWEFGDNNFSSQLSPTHLYNNVDTFNVTLTVLNPNTGCSTIKEKPLVVKPVPAVGFIANDVCEESITLYTDTSTLEYGTINSWLWDLGNGANSQIQNPSATYSDPGVKTISLMVTSNLGCSSTGTQTIEVYEKPTAIFIPNPLFGSPPLTVNFINNSIGATTYNWDFGDGTIGTDTNPIHLYTDTGNYSIAMIATSMEGCADTAYNIVSVLIPFMDLTVTSITYNRAGDLFRLGATIVNQGNVTVNKFRIIGITEGSTPISENWIGSLNPGQQTMFEFDASFIVPLGVTPGYFCVNAIEPNDGTDDVPENNEYCKVSKNTFEILNVTPNPFADELTVNFNSNENANGEIRIYDSTGRLVFNSGAILFQKGFNRVETNTINLAKGIYTLVVYLNNQQKVIKVLKK